MTNIPLIAQGSVTFEATISNRQVPLDGYAEVVFTLKNGVGSDFKAPDFEGFEVVSGPSKSISTTVINSVVTRAFGYTYLLRPLRKGTLNIKPASIKVGNQLYKTASIAVTAVAKAHHTAAKGKIKPDLMLKAEVTSPEMYIGQQGVVTYFLYSNVPVQDIRLEKEADYNGFFVKNRNVQWSSNETEILGGREYYKYTIKKVSIFAQAEGSKVIEPMALTVLVSISDGKNDFWGIEESEAVTVKSNELNIKVAQIPQSDVETFSGAVGQFQTSANLAPTIVKAGKPTVLKITVTGNGDPNRLFPSFLSPSDSFEIFEPKTSEELFVESGELLTSSKTIEYTIVPKLAGKFDIQPKLFFFDPIQKNFDYTAEISLSLQADEFSTLEVSNKGTSTFTTKNYLYVLALAILVIGTLLWLKFHKKPVQMASKSELLQQLSSANLDYEGLSSLVRTYLCDTFQISTTEFVTKNISKILIEKGLDPVKANNWQNVVMHLQANTYAPVSDENIQSDIQQIKLLL